MRIIVFISLIVIFFSCKKNPFNPGDSYWILGSQRYDVASLQRESGNYFVLSGIDGANPADTMKLYFQSMPVNDGTFTVKEFQPNTALNPKEIGIEIKVPLTGSYFSTGIANNNTWSPAQKANVFVNDGKISVIIPKMTTIIVTSRYLDSTFIQGVLSEK